MARKITWIRDQCGVRKKVPSDKIFELMMGIYTKTLTRVLIHAPLNPNTINRQSSDTASH